MESTIQLHEELWNVERKFLCCHVTAVKFISDYLLVGEGNRVLLFNWKRKEILEEETVFQQCSVHGIKVGHDNSKSMTLLFYGAKCLRVYLFYPKKNKRLVVLSEEQHMNDWICDAQLLDANASRNYVISLILAHNCVILWNYEEKKEEEKIQCQVNCILYSANIIVYNANAIVLAVGTVFQEVLIWSPSTKDKTKEPLHRLTGHQGVIFSIAYSSNHKLLCSTSDDRSLRLWKIKSPSPTCQDSTLEFWEKSSIHMIHILYAHESRIWMSVILNNCILSVGEDSNICFWDHNGGLLKKEKSYKNGSIWCIDVNAENSVAVTGGSDGGLCLWNIPDSLAPLSVSQMPLHHLSTDETDFPRVICLLTYKETNVLLVTTDKGYLSSYVINNKEWKDLFYDPTFISYCVPAVSPQNDYIALGNMNGEIVFLYNNDNFCDHWDHSKFKIHHGKINNIHWVDKSSEYILSCGLNGLLVLWHLTKCKNKLEMNCMRKMHLPESKRHWWSTAALFLKSDDCLVVGDRSGNLSAYFHVLYKADNLEKIEPSIMYRSIHGDNGVTAIEKHKDAIFSVGRDGRVLLYETCDAKLKLLHSVKVLHNLEWIGRIVFHENDMLLLGFHTTRFVVWSFKRESTIMSVDCGGGHRSWDFSLNKCEATFAAVKKKEIMLSFESLQFKLKQSNLKVGISGREFCYIIYLFTTEYQNQDPMSVVAVGGEDNSLKIFGITNQTSIVPICNLSGHISSIKSIAKCEMLKEDCYLVVSVGGRAQMFIWKIKNDRNITCEELASDIFHSKKVKGKKPWKDDIDSNANSQIRYMDVVVFISDLSSEMSEKYFIATACSDGFFRLHSFDVNLKKLTHCYTLHHGDHCILKLSHFEIKENLTEKHFFATGSTNGTLKIFQQKDLDHSLEYDIKRHLEKSDKFDEQNRLSLKITMHQSGINALDIKCLPGSRFLICTGGDDNALSAVLVQILQIDSEKKITVIAKGSVKQAHASQITGLKFLEDQTIASVSIDQRFSLWNWTIKEESATIDIHLKTSNVSSVPDIAHLEIWKNEYSNTFSAVVCGEGIESFCLSSVT